MKPYQQVPIQDCAEPLVPLPLDQLAVVTPHPYQVLGAPYGDRSPYWLRAGVVTALLQAQAHLQAQRPGWRLQIFDAYRPIAVQRFMVDYTAEQLAQQQGQRFEALTDTAQQALLQEVYQFWALPSLDPATPPPHSTGAAVDITLVDESGQPVNMGSPIDEVSVRSHPDHFQSCTDADSQQAHAHRCLLRQCLAAAGFRQHPHEWWHFSRGDQLWAWLMTQATGAPHTAYYGRAEPVRYPVQLRPVTPADQAVWLHLRQALWPDTPVARHQAEIATFFAQQTREPLAVLLAVGDREQAIGFVELSIRAYAEGCDTQQVAYVEGWYVAPECRGQGVGRALIQAAEDWGRRQGCTELASDAEADNEVSRLAHGAVGFTDVGLVRCFRKDL